MTTLLPHAVRSVVGDAATECSSRSLFFDRFADPRIEKEEEKTWYRAAFSKSPEIQRLAACQRLLKRSEGRSHVVFGQLLSRLTINLAGSVMENAGLCLDRFGVPYVPGSAVKGCARRMALAALRKWCEAEMRPEAASNPATVLCSDFEKPADFLETVLLVFGWVEQDWAEKADLAWACAGSSHELLTEVQSRLRRRLRVDNGELPNFGGLIAFLPAHPMCEVDPSQLPGLSLPVPEIGKLELDVVTVHHREYYGDPSMAFASDTEEPVPNYFPAVAAGHVFAFPLRVLRNADRTLLDHAAAFLRTGIVTFGLGAKTNAGYGWFHDLTDDFDAKRERDEAIAKLVADAAFLESLKEMEDGPRRSVINAFSFEESYWKEEDEARQLAVLEFLQSSDNPYSDDLAKPKSKIAKAFANLCAKFNP